MKFGDRKPQKLSAQDNKLLYEGYTKTDERTKQPIYDGAGYLFNNETKCFFKGTWSNHEKVCGIETFPNGDVYEGSYVDGKFSGIGLLYNNVNGRYRYEGNFKNGKRHGQGKEEYITGGQYEGYFREGLKHGEGKLTFADASYYMGDFQKGLPNGFGLHVAYQQDRIISVFPLMKKVAKKVEDSEEYSMSEPSVNQQAGTGDEINKSNAEYYYEGDFVDGYKHGVGRLYEPSGSYFYSYWEYNRPGTLKPQTFKVGKTVYYNADEHNWKVMELKEMSECQSIDFYEILKTTGWEKLPTRASGYPDYRLDCYKCMIDEKGLKREHFEDPDFDFSESAINIKDENQQVVAAPCEPKRIFEIQHFKKNGYKLFTEEIKPGCLRYAEQYSCQQLTCVLDAMTYHSFLFQKIFSRKYDTEYHYSIEPKRIGFYTLKLYIRNEWKEFIIDDLVPAYKTDDSPIFSNSAKQELGWVLIFKSFAKMKQSFTYFDGNKTQDAETLLNMLTGIPCKTISVATLFPGQEGQLDDEAAVLRLWKSLTEKHQKTQIRICYLRKDKSLKNVIPGNFAYHLVDGQQASQSKQGEEDKFVLLKSMIVPWTLKTDLNDPFTFSQLDKSQQQAMNKLRERNPQCADDQRYFIMGFGEFIQHFDNVVVLAGTKYPVHNHIEIVPKEADLYNNELRVFSKFCINLPSSMLFCITQSPLSDEKNENGEHLESEAYLPIRIVLAKEKDIYTNKSQIKKSVTKSWQSFKSDTPKPEPVTNSAVQRRQSAAPGKAMKDQHGGDMVRKSDNKPKPFRYIFGRGQRKTRQVYKEITLESGIYILLVQIEQGDNKKTQASQSLEKLRFHFNLYAQTLVQIERIPQINGFQKIVYETAILNAEKYLINEGKEPKFFSKVDLSERENGSSDLIIIQYFLKHEGTYLQYLRNKSTNKIWRQKLYFRVENMIILDQSDASKVDLQLNTSDRRTELVVIQQIGAKPYNLEGGEGICIIDIQSEKREGEFQEDEEAQILSGPEDGAEEGHEPPTGQKKVEFAKAFNQIQ